LRSPPPPPPTPFPYTTLFRSVPAEILRNDNRGGRLALTNDVTRCVGCRRFYVEVLIASKLSNERSGNVAFVLVNYQHRYFARLSGAFLPSEQVPEEGAAKNGD